PQGQSEPGLCGTAGGSAPGGRAPLARHLHALRSRILRRRDVPSRADRESVWSNRVTHVSGIIRYPCTRDGPPKYGVPNCTSLEPDLSIPPHNAAAKAIGRIGSVTTALPP